MGRMYVVEHKTTAVVNRHVRAVGNPVRGARERIDNAMVDMMSVDAGAGAPTPGGERPRGP